MISFSRPVTSDQSRAIVSSKPASAVTGITAMLVAAAFFPLPMVVAGAVRDSPEPAFDRSRTRVSRPISMRRYKRRSKSDETAALRLLKTLAPAP